MIIATKEHHLSEILSIENKSFNKPWSKLQLINDIQSNKEVENWVYLLNMQLVGYIFGTIILDEYHLNNVAVHPNYLRKMICTKLISHVKDRLLLKKIKVILLEVSSKNIPAHKCYQSLGFKSVGIRKNYYSKGDDAVLYNLEIKNNG